MTINNCLLLLDEQPMHCCLVETNIGADGAIKHNA